VEFQQEFTLGIAAAQVAVVLGLLMSAGVSVLVGFIVTSAISEDAATRRSIISGVSSVSAAENDLNPNRNTVKCAPVFFLHFQ
jgi:hypothetical protein